MKYLVITCTFLLFSFSGYCGSKDTFEVYFPFNVSKLGKEHQTYIDKLISKDSLLHSDKLMVLGYTDYVGGSAYNDTLSLLRAKNVRDYLMSAGFKEEDIKLCTGKGKIDRNNTASKTGYAPDRKVQIIIDREEMEKTAPMPDDPGGNDRIDIKRLKVNQAFALYNIYFKLNKAILLPESEPDLQKLLEFMKQNPTVTVQVEGHVCCMGPIEGVDSRSKDGNLSENRAKAIYNYLVEKGIAKERMKYAGLANNNPVVRNEVTELDKRKNRRVEIRILSK